MLKKFIDYLFDVEPEKKSFYVEVDNKAINQLLENTKYNYKNFMVVGTSVHKENIKSILRKGNPSYTDFVYKIKEDYVTFKIKNEDGTNAIGVYMHDVLIGYVPYPIVDKLKPHIKDNDFIGKIWGGDIRATGGIIEKDFSCEITMVED